MYNPTKPYKSSIKDMIRETWANNPFLTIEEGYYNTFRNSTNHLHEVDHTDGLGTKGLLHWQNKSFAAAAQDALAMNVNDLAIVGARAYKTQVHLILPEEDESAIKSIIGELVKLCKIRHIAITGGETSIQNTLMGMELSLTMSGVVLDTRSKTANYGDKLICLPSSGIHSNGISFVREIYGDACPAWTTVPTKLYDFLVGSGLPINAAMHITGGAWDKLRDVLPKRSVAELGNWTIPDCFLEIYAKGNIPWTKMFERFNMGVGMVLSVAPKNAEYVANKVHGFIGGEIKEDNTINDSKVVIHNKFGEIVLL